MFYSKNDIFLQRIGPMYFTAQPRLYGKLSYS